MNTIPETNVFNQSKITFDEAFAWAAYREMMNLEKLKFDVIPETPNHWEVSHADIN